MAFRVTLVCRTQEVLALEALSFCICMLNKLEHYFISYYGKRNVIYTIESWAVIGRLLYGIKLKVPGVTVTG